MVGDFFVQIEGDTIRRMTAEGVCVLNAGACGGVWVDLHLYAGSRAVDAAALRPPA